MVRQTLTQSRLKELLEYDELTGLFIWLKSVNSRSEVGFVAGTICDNGYVLIGLDGHIHSAHRLAFLYMKGEIPDIIDHKNGVKSFNAWSNLRVASQYQNRLNSVVMSNNVLGVKGVCWVESRKRYKACVTIDKSKSRIRKYFKELKDAIQWLSETRLINHEGFENNG